MLSIGKTTTLVELIIQCVARGERVLACAPSNIAVDNLVERIVKASSYNENHRSIKPSSLSITVSSSASVSSTSAFHGFRCIRVGHPARLLPSVLDHSLDATVKHSDGGAITRDIENEMQGLQQSIFKSRDKQDKYRLRGEYKRLQGELRFRQKKAVKDTLDGCSVMCTTLMGAAGHTLQEYIFDTVIIDEAAQALEVACLAPILLCKHRLILAGDHQQLGPVIKCVSAAEGGLSLTLFDRLARSCYAEQLLIMLNEQYRMNEIIMQWTSQEFYHGALTAPIDIQEQRLHKLKGVKNNSITLAPMVFIDTAGCQMYEDEANTALDSSASKLSLTHAASKSNQHEISLVKKHLLSLLAAGVSISSIGVLSPYLAQIGLLRDALLSDYPALEIGTIDCMQGRECDAIIISLVRSNEQHIVGFLSEARRLNVAITRARCHVCIIGDSDTCNQSQQPFLKRLMDYLMNTEQVEYLSAMSNETDTVTATFTMLVASAPTASAARVTKSAPSTKAPVQSTAGASSGVTRPVHSTANETTSSSGDAATESQVTSVTETFDRERIESICRELLSSSSSTSSSFTFPSSLASDQRRLIHEVAEKFADQLTHESRGKGSKRSITISKQQNKQTPMVKESPRDERETQRMKALEKMEQNARGKGGEQSATTTFKPRAPLPATTVSAIEAAGITVPTSASHEEKEEEKADEAFDTLSDEDQDDAQSVERDQAEIEHKHNSNSNTNETQQPNLHKSNQQKQNRKDKGKHSSSTATANNADDREEEDLDAILSSLSVGVTVCHSVGCSRSVVGEFSGSNCSYCHFRYCHSHNNPILHGCAAQVKEAALARDLRRLHESNQGRAKPLKAEQKQQLSVKLKQKASALRSQGEKEKEKPKAKKK